MQRSAFISASPGADQLTKELSEMLPASILTTAKHTRFLNTSSFARVEPHDFSQVYVVQAANPPVNDRKMEVECMVAALRSLSPTLRITVVMPYVLYSRSSANTPGVSCGLDLFANSLAYAGASAVISLDLHDVGSTKYFTDKGIDYHTVSALPSLSEWAQANIPYNVIVAADKSSAARAELFTAAGTPLIIMDKVRPDDTGAVKLSLSDHNRQALEGATVLIVDDEADRCTTLMANSDLVWKCRPERLFALVIHAQLSYEPGEFLMPEFNLRNHYVNKLITTDSIPKDPLVWAAFEKKSRATRLPLTAPLIAEAIRRLEIDQPTGNIIVPL
ncbi:ribose-phosphate diphosphokinase [Candidatus Saccharibacteria bacterium]|nr:ribose-phosphate diphosphokinase [Candidatus Saccharibacteria bacterium]